MEPHSGGTMYAAAVDRAAARLRELRDEAWRDAGVAALSFGLAIAATHFQPDFAVPLLVGGLALAGLTVRALFRRWELIEELMLDRDAYGIPEVRARAEQAATLERRRSLSVSIRGALDAPLPGAGPGAAACRAELEELAGELDDSTLVLDPLCAVACEQLLCGTTDSPLYSRHWQREEVRSLVWQIRSGFRAEDGSDESGRVESSRPRRPHPVGIHAARSTNR